jgi:predicted aspartyl protease
MVLGKHISFFLDTGASRSVLTKYSGPLKKASFPVVE